MAGNASAYAVLGVDPAADAAEIEQAYRRLIKQHHPDRDGGDASRAAEINRAYGELRAVRDLKDPLDFNLDGPATPRSGRAWILLTALLALGAGWLLWPQSGFAPPVQPQRAGNDGLVLAGHQRGPEGGDPMDVALNVAGVEAAATEALHIARTRDEIDLASASRECHRVLRSKPLLAQFDRCAAFDDAVVQLEDRDPLRDQGPFSELAVTGRLWSAASGLSQDSVAIDARLDRIRLQVELTLARAGRALEPPSAPLKP